jgi:hypothetical protein
VKIVGAEWSPKPKAAALAAALVDKHEHKWIANQNEDSRAQIKKYMKHLHQILSLPEGHGIADCTQSTNLLSIDCHSPDIKLKGTTDVMITENKNIKNEATRQNAKILLELKKATEKLTIVDHEPQAIVEHIAASLLNPTEGILTVLTDLIDEWVFYWFDHTGLWMLKLVVSRKEAQFLLDNMFPKGKKSKNLPSDFWKRGKMKTILERLESSTTERVDDDDDDEEEEHPKQPPSRKRKSEKSDDDSEGDVDKGTGGNTQQKRSRDDRHQNRSSAKSQQGKHHSVAQFLDCVDSDLGDEFRTEEDFDERMQIARSFAAKYFLPGMAPPVKLPDQGATDVIPRNIFIQ